MSRIPNECCCAYDVSPICVKRTLYGVIAYKALPRREFATWSVVAQGARKRICSYVKYKAPTHKNAYSAQNPNAQKYFILCKSYYKTHVQCHTTHTRHTDDRGVVESARTRAVWGWAAPVGCRLCGARAVSKARAEVEFA